jgi:hypothetical protein
MKLPLISLWASLALLLASMVIGGRLCLDAIREINLGASTATGTLEFISPTWIIMKADAVTVCLWWLMIASVLSLLAVAMSTVWLTLVAGRKSRAELETDVDNPS